MTDDPTAGASDDAPTDDGPVGDEPLRIVLVAAVAANDVIGRDGEMPWHLPEDMAHFRETTTGHPVVLGRRTYESIVAGLGGPLPDRTNVVLTRTGVDGGASDDQDGRSAEDGAGTTRVVEAGSVEAALEVARSDARERGVDTVYVAGGETVYEQFLPRADRLVLTELDGSYEGDTRFPTWDREVYSAVERDERDGFAFVTYERVPEE